MRHQLQTCKDQFGHPCPTLREAVLLGYTINESAWVEVTVNTAHTVLDKI